jgi:hypothetical protein
MRGDGPELRAAEAGSKSAVRLPITFRSVSTELSNKSRRRKRFRWHVPNETLGD